MDGSFGFVVIELGVALATTPGREAEARGAAHLAESTCIVGYALTAPIKVELEVAAAEPAAA
jgi:organic hydroperoxide reductase OsmC/OhrA